MENVGLSRCSLLCLLSRHEHSNKYPHVKIDAHRKHRHDILLISTRVALETMQEYSQSILVAELPFYWIRPVLHPARFVRIPAKDSHIRCSDAQQTSIADGLDCTVEQRDWSAIGVKVNDVVLVWFLQHENSRVRLERLHLVFHTVVGDISLHIFQCSSVQVVCIHFANFRNFECISHCSEPGRCHSLQNFNWRRFFLILLLHFQSLAFLLVVFFHFFLLLLLLSSVLSLWASSESGSHMFIVVFQFLLPLLDEGLYHSN
mmetsp:Transcript_33/g.78  ORF Transcript_33/g.78 Transcript_33/m.78 type:complete len:260 (+) Transcript_33:1328-2107(+)